MHAGFLSVPTNGELVKLPLVLHFSKKIIHYCSSESLDDPQGSNVFYKTISLQEFVSTVT